MDLDDLFQKALDGYIFELQYELEIAGEIVPVKIKNFSQRSVGRIQLLNYEAEVARGMAKGLHKQPINEKEWKNHLSQIDDPEIRKQRKSRPPESRAHQLAENLSMQETVMAIIPEKLLNMDGTPFLTTEDRKDKFRLLIENSPALYNQMFKIYLDIYAKEKEIREQAKN
jgi:hypothetical protein